MTLDFQFRRVAEIAGRFGVTMPEYDAEVKTQMLELVVAALSRLDQRIATLEQAVHTLEQARRENDSRR